MPIKIFFAQMMHWKRAFAINVCWWCCWLRLGASFLGPTCIQSHWGSSSTWNKYRNVRFLFLKKLKLTIHISKSAGSLCLSSFWYSKHLPESVTRNRCHCRHWDFFWLPKLCSISCQTNQIAPKTNISSHWHLKTDKLELSRSWGQLIVREWKEKHKIVTRMFHFTLSFCLYANIAQTLFTLFLSLNSALWATHDQ